MTNPPTSTDTADLLALRDRDFLDAMQRKDLDEARRIARLPVPNGATNEQRTSWGARRHILRTIA